MTNTITLKELRPSLPRVIEDIDGKMDRFVVTKRGKPVAVMISMDDYEAMLETMDVLTDRETMKRITKGESQISQGKTKSWKEVKKHLG